MAIKHVILTAGATASSAAIGSLAAEDVQSEWYAELRKPGFQPPPLVFPIAWSLLYSSIAVGSARALAAASPEEERSFWRALLTNLGLNAGWSWVFFKGHNVPAATAVATLLAASSAALARKAARIDPKAGWILAPYAGWTAFATVLTATIWTLNRKS